MTNLNTQDGFHFKENKAIDTGLCKQLCKPLNMNDIEFRVGTTSAKGFSLLMYKTARADVKRLNDVFGLNWQNSYSYDSKGNLLCKISVFTGVEWISRIDVGTESNTEKEKGSYSDSFKRAGFKFGIGIELYQSPFIWVNWKMSAKDQGKGYKHDDYFDSKKIIIEDYIVKEGIPYVKISYPNKGIIFNNIDSKANQAQIQAQPKMTLEKISIQILEAKTYNDLKVIYNTYKSRSDAEKIQNLCTQRKGEIENGQ